MLQLKRTFYRELYLEIKQKIKSKDTFHVRYYIDKHPSYNDSYVYCESVNDKLREYHLKYNTECDYMDLNNETFLFIASYIKGKMWKYKGVKCNIVCDHYGYYFEVVRFK